MRREYEALISLTAYLYHTAFSLIQDAFSQSVLIPPGSEVQLKKILRLL